MSGPRTRAEPRLIWVNTARDAYARRAKARAERDIWRRIGINEERARAVLDIARSAGAELWFSSPTTLEIDVPRSLPESLRRALFMHLFFNHRPIAAILEGEGAEP